MTSQRSASIDLVRVLGVVAIVAGHAWTTDSTWRDLLYAWHVPVFFFLSGYLWRPARSVRDEARSRTRSTLVPYLSWLAIVAPIYLVTIAVTGEADLLRGVARVILGGAWIGPPFSAFWFMTALFFCAVASRWLLNQRRGALAAVAVGSAAYLAAIVAPGPVSKIPLSAGVALACVPLLLAGMGFARMGRTPPAAGPVLLLAGLAVVAAGWVDPVRLKFADVGTPLAGYAVAVVISAGLILTAELVTPVRLGAGIVMLASAATAVVLSHSLVLWAGARLLPGMTLVVFLAALLLPWVAALWVRRTRWSPYLTGAQPSPVRR